MSSLLLEGGAVVPVDGDRSVFDPGHVLIEDGIIISTGKGSYQGKADRTLDVSNCVVVPGFVNAHQHHWYSLSRASARACCWSSGSATCCCPVAPR